MDPQARLRDEVLFAVSGLAADDIGASTEAVAELFRSPFLADMVENNEYINHLTPQETSIDRHLKSEAGKLSSSAFLSTKKSRELAGPLVEEIITLHEALHVLLECYEDLIRKR